MAESRQNSASANPEAAQAKAALAAWEEGEAARAAGDKAAAVRWFDRAHRLAPKEDRITLSLALALLSEGDPTAAALLGEVTEHRDLKAAWLALAVAQHRVGNTPAAAEALGSALSGHAWKRDEAAGAETLVRIAANTGRPGWCALAGGGALLVGPERLRGVAMSLDGRAWAQRRLPAGWEQARELVVSAGGRELLGSPIRIAAIRRTEGFVEPRNGGFGGWAWHPGEPEREPVLGIGPADAAKPAFTIRARERGVHLPEVALLANPLGFTVPRELLADLRGAISVRDRDGRELTGSPLDPGLEAAGVSALAKAIAVRLPALGRKGNGRLDPAALDVAGIPTRATVAPVRRRAGRPGPVDIVVPVHGGGAVVMDCLESVLRHLPEKGRIIVVDDASPEPELSRKLIHMAAEGKIHLIRWTHARGYPAACNAGIRAARMGADIVLLNSDTRVSAGWISGLQAAVLSAADIGTGTPLSNDATILSYPKRGRRNPAPDEEASERLAKLARRLHRGQTAEVPTGVGFCLYLRRACIEEVGLFREGLFAQGYGEESDFCMRARDLGWRHVAAPGVFVTHLGGKSFNAAGPALWRRNHRILNRLHPGYDDLVAAHEEADPLFPFRRRLDAARLAHGRCESAVLLITHARGGGVAKLIEARAAALRAAGERPILLNPAKEEGAEHHVLVSEAGGEALVNLRYAVPAELGALCRLLRAERPKYCEVHHLVGHDHAILEVCRRLRIPYDVWLHDYASFCGRIALVGRDQRYCGEPALEVCAACVADAGSEIEEDIAPADLVRRSGAELRAARRIVAPSEDAARRTQRHFPELRITVEPWEDDAAFPATAPCRFGLPRTVAVIGAIGDAKGYEVLLAAARDAAWRNLALRFVLIGYSRDDRRLLETGRVFVTGPYEEYELPKLIAREKPDFAFLPSVWPETWCFALSEAWQAGLAVAAFDLGAQAARIRATGRGWLLPLGLSPSAINNALLNLNPLAHA